MELYRHSILIHDDIVDAEEQRRGGDTLHKTLGKGFDERFGVGSALFAGNILYARALESVLESGFDQKMLLDVLRLLATEYKAVNESQILDMLFEYKEPTPKNGRLWLAEEQHHYSRHQCSPGLCWQLRP